MKRNELLTKGEYFGLPKSLAKDTRLNATAKLVWAVIVDRLGENNETAWPGKETIAEDAGISLSSAKRAVAELEDAGWISVGRGVRRSCDYTARLAPARPVQSDPVQNEPLDRFNLNPLPVQLDPLNRSKLNPELPNRTTAVTTETNDRSFAGAAAPSAIAAAPALPDAVPLISGGAAGNDTGAHRPPAAQGQVKPVGPTATGPVGVVVAGKITEPGGRQARGPKGRPAGAEGRYLDRVGASATSLTDDEKVRLQTDPEAMKRWLMWGVPGLREQQKVAAIDMVGLKPAAANFIQFATMAEKEGKQVVVDVGCDKWNANHFSGYFICRVAYFNKAKGLPTADFPNFGRLGRIMTDLLAGSTKPQVYLRLKFIVDNWDLIRYRSKGINVGVLNESSALQHQVIRNNTTELMQMGEFQRESIRDQMKAEMGHGDMAVGATAGWPRLAHSFPVGSDDGTARTPQSLPLRADHRKAPLTTIEQTFRRRGPVYPGEHCVPY